jgi:hypothetical protein
MITSKYEDLYVSTRNAKIATAYVNKVVELLSDSTLPITPKEIGLYLFGADYLNPVETITPNYHHNYTKACQRATIGQIMRHLHKAGLVKREYLDGDPIEIETTEWVPNEPYIVPQYINVHDDEGNTYQMENPKWDWVKAMNARNYGQPVRVKKTIIPKIKAWLWVGEK